MMAKIIPVDFKSRAEINFDSKEPSEAFKRGAAVMKVIYEKPVNCVWLRLGLNRLVETGSINIKEAEYISKIMGFEAFWL